MGQIAHGDARAFGQLYDLTAARIFGLARALLRNDHLAEDTTQDVYLSIWRQAANFDKAKSPAISWMLMMTHARSIDRLRQSEKLRRQDRYFATNSFSRNNNDSIADHVIRSENDALVRASLAALTTLQRQAIDLIYFRSHTNAEASALLGIPIPTFKARTHAALTALRQHAGGRPGVTVNRPGRTGRPASSPRPNGCS